MTNDSCCDKPSDRTFIIRDMETLKVVADTLRSQILELLLQKPQTVGQAAEKLGASPNKLYYHFNLLEKHGLIEVAETHMVANIIEKVYRAAARYIDVEPSLLSFSTEAGKEAMQTFISPVIDTTREDLVRSLQARQFQLEQGAAEHPRQIVISREVSHLPEDRLDEFVQRVKSLIDDFCEADSGAPTADSPSHALAIAFYPTFYFEQPE
jgi:predicted ArsR family transcriptional regulator